MLEVQDVIDENRQEPKTNKGWSNLIPAQKGEVRNPRGRPKKDLDLAAAAQKHAMKALETLVTVMSSEDATPSARVSAASEVLDRGFGRAPQSIDVTHQIGFSEQFEDYMRGLMGRNNRVIDHAVVDAD